MIHILFLFSLLSITCNASVNDFCVADLKGPYSPSGYPCKPTNTVTVNDFVFSGFVAGNTTNPFNVGLTTAFVNNVPGLNGLGISVARLDIPKGGSAPIHTHSGATELVIMVEGEMIAGFMTNTEIYTKTLKVGDVMVLPQGLFHFFVNTGNGTATSFLAFNSENFIPQLPHLVLFANNLPSNLVAQTTFLDVDQVKKLKARFGGTN